MFAIDRSWRWFGIRGLLLALAPCVGTSGPAVAGSFSVLTYNVAGLPLGFSGSSPEVNTVQISPRLNDFDLVVVQEDFGFHEELVSAIVHPFATVKDTTDVPFVIGLFAPEPPPQLGDGLNTFAFHPFADFARVTWNDCFGVLTEGSDCLAPKGFSFARHEVESGVFVDVYNLHADAGGDPDSVTARRANLRQLADFILVASDGNAVIVLGDTNSRYTREGDILPEFLATTGVSDVWVELARGGVFPEVGPSLQEGCTISFADANCERVDKIFYRSGSEIELTTLAYAVPEDWVDANGVQLSDHEPVSAVFHIRAIPEPTTGASIMTGIAMLAAIRKRPPSRR